jgi:DNA-binding beta-propeller fold protein YncE
MKAILYRTCLSLAALVAPLDTVGDCADVELEQVWTHSAGGEARAEIVAYDAANEQLLVVNGDERCVTRLDARTGRERGRFDVARWGDPTSVAASRGLVAVAVVARRATDAGWVVLFESKPSPGTSRKGTGSGAVPIRIVRVGAMPDMVTFTPDGRYVLAANEGEPSGDYRVDPEGSVSVIDVGRGAEHAVALTADFTAFNSERDALEADGVRINGPSSIAADGRATVAQDFEPEYIAVAPDGLTAWVTLQENNALAEIDIRAARVRRVIALGQKDHLRRANGFDASNRDGGVHIRRWPVFGMYQPDGIATFTTQGEALLATANEGDGREYGDYTDMARVGDLPLDAALLRDDPQLQADDRLGRLIVDRSGGDTDGDGDVDQLLAFGARSMAIWDADGAKVFDSGDAIEQFIAEQLPERFNISDDGEGSIDKRSPEKGPEPEGIAVGRVGERVIAFVGLERTSAVALFDVTRPASTRLLDVVPLGFDANSPAGRNIAPEGLAFIAAEKSPLGEPLLAVACEVTGTTILFRVHTAR